MGKNPKNQDRTMYIQREGPMPSRRLILLYRGKNPKKQANHTYVLWRMYGAKVLCIWQVHRYVCTTEIVFGLR